MMFPPALRFCTARLLVARLSVVWPCVLSLCVLPLCVLPLFWGNGYSADPSKRFVYLNDQGVLVYDRNDRGDQILDFSHAGYGGGNAKIPEMEVRVVVQPSSGDQTQCIQAAIDHVSGLKPDDRGFRGTVLFKPGRFEVSGQLRITASGIVLRGAGSDADRGTVIIAKGTDRRALIMVRGGPEMSEQIKNSVPILDEYVPLGSQRIKVPATGAFQVGDLVCIEHPSTKEWIHALGMNRFPSRDVGSWLDWKPGTLNLHWERQVVQADQDTIILDVPLTNPLNQQLSQATVRVMNWPNRIAQVGIEQLRLESETDPDQPCDENHAWDAIVLSNVRDAWVRDVSMRGFAGSAVNVMETASRVSVLRCLSVEPVSELGAYRRRTFFCNGGQTLFAHCKSDGGRNDFAVGHLAAGPNVFLHCISKNSNGPSGGIESWAHGTLFDNVEIEAGALELTNHETANQGTGWSAAGSVLWQCTAPMIVCRNPPTSTNWSMGCWGEFVGDGHWRSMNEFVEPKSLYAKQFESRCGRPLDESLDQDQMVIPSQAILFKSSMPSLSKETHRDDKSKQWMQINSGWITVDGRMVFGKRLQLPWWRGHTLPERAKEFGPALTRFVPGREMLGFTDDLGDVAKYMKSQGYAAVEHHWGLWYDRRRDDHQMIKRINGQVWAPFYEQPWLRSGQGTAWDGLSKYDLERFNPWYFNRLKAFASLCDQHGLLLIEQMYFQHNILEAGAHWVDFPWRPANCLQATGFPEPPPFENRKRIDVSTEFYDIQHPVRRRLHEAYIRHCLDELSTASNVIFSLGEEFTGPETFMRFWLETVKRWQQENKRDVFIMLSCTKDVQDAILNDPELTDLIDIIDMKYWWYTSDGSLYAPAGDQHLAPRQQLRNWTGNRKRSGLQIARQIQEYRLRYPDKAVICSIDGVDGVQQFLSGGSLAPLSNVPTDTTRELTKYVPWTMGPNVADRAPLLILKGSVNESWMMGVPEAACEVGGWAPGEYRVQSMDPKTLQPTGNCKVEHLEKLWRVNPNDYSTSILQLEQLR